MELRKIIRTDIAASAVAHLTLVALIILISEVHPFHAAVPETVSVDIVTPEQVKEEEAKAEEKAQEQAKEKPPEPLPDLKLPKLDFSDKDKAEAAPKPATQQQAAAPSPSPQASPEPQQKQPQPQPSQAPKQREANVQPQPSQQPPPQPQQQPPPQAMPQPPSQQPPPQAMQQPQAAPPAYQAPEPDVTVKYGVMLGLPPELPPELPKDAPKDDGGDAKDSIAAKLPSEVVAALRRHLKSCQAAGRGRPDRQRQHQAAHGVRHRRHAGAPADPDRSSAIREGRGHREIRDRSAPGLPALQDAAGRQIRGMEGVGLAVLAAGFWRGIGCLAAIRARRDRRGPCRRRASALRELATARASRPRRRGTG